MAPVLTKLSSKTSDMLPAFEAKDSKTVNNPIEAYIVAEVLSLLEML